MAGNLSANLTSFTATYCLHSTLLLGSAWLLLRWMKPDSHFVRERIWKLAATAGLTTAAIQLATGLGLRIAPSPEPSVPIVTRSVSEAAGEPSPEVTSPSPSQAQAARQHLATSLAIVQDSLHQLGEGLPETLSRPKSDPDEKISVASSVSSGQIASDPAGSAIFDSVSSTSYATTIDAAPAARRGEAAPAFRLQPAAQSTSRDRSVSSTSGQARLTPTGPLQLGLGPLATLAWFALSGLILAWQSLRFRWQMRRLCEAAPSHRKLLDAICENRGVRRKVRLLRSDRFEEPVAYGLFRWTILLPAQVEKRLNRDELAALLSHELAHLTRGDILWLLIGRVLTTCLAFQPLNFLARRRWQQHAEFQCDDWTVDRSVDRVTLARSLTLVAEWRAGRKACAGVVSAGGSRFHISDRVERLLADAVPDVWKRRSRRIGIHLAALCAAAAVIVFGPQTGSAERAAPPEERPPGKAELVEPPPTPNPAIANEASPAASISEFVREVESLSGDVSELLAELRTLEPVLAELEQRPDLSDQVAQLRIRIGLLRRVAEVRARSAENKLQAAGRRQQVARGVSPGINDPFKSKSPGGATPESGRRSDVAPPGLKSKLKSQPGADAPGYPMPPLRGS